ncbi:unnamed protein product [Allacma fusca]|uniref:Uncharacterized protein n=1 Tax=Allacma fusca TaxID=39272 RepID=A0A8J2KZ03_9HEXA|nr:unnamed protein product [Allacma fusca]
MKEILRQTQDYVSDGNGNYLRSQMCFNMEKKIRWVLQPATTTIWTSYFREHCHESRFVLPDGRKQQSNAGVTRYNTSTER